MLTEIPTADGLSQSGLGYLNLAWADATSLLAEAKQWEELREHAPEGEDPVRYHWVRAERRLATCAMLVHQGAEFLIKARIAAVSPYLLLESPSSWPGDIAKADAPFGELKTIDAQYLVRVHDTICTTRLTEPFKVGFEAMRRRRNQIMHGLGAGVVPSAVNVAMDVLQVSTELLGDGSWPKIRRDYELGDPNANWDHHGQIVAGLMFEFDEMIATLPPAECLRHLGFPKKQRRYLCPRCRTGDVFSGVKLAVLSPNRPQADTLFCIACGESSKVERILCQKCPGNVTRDGCCLNCGFDGE